MKYNLTEADTKELRYACRAGIILPVLITLISNLLLFLVVYANKYSYTDTGIQLVVIATIVIPLLIGYMMNRKLMADLKNGEKVAERKVVRMKEKNSDFEAGSGIVGKIGRPMNQFDRYDLIIDNRRVRVDKELYEKVEEGGEVDLFYARESRYLLQIEIHKPWQTVAQ
jgi:hypothetical protein